MKKSLKNTLVYSYLGITLALLVLLGSVFYIFIGRYADQKEREVVIDTASQIASELVKYLDREPSLSELERFFESIESLKGIKVELVDAYGESLFDLFHDDDHIEFSEGLTAADIFGDSTQMGQAFSQYTNIHGRQMGPGMMSRSTSGSSRGFEILYSDYEDNEEEVKFSMGLKNSGLSVNNEELTGSIIFEAEDGDLRKSIVQPALISFGSASLIGLLLAGVMGWIMGRRLTRPLVTLTGTVSGMRGGDLSVRADQKETAREDEIGQLAKTFNEMADELSLTVEDLQNERDTMRNFLSDASHELRTPLTALISYLELLEGKGSHDVTRRREYIDKGRVQADRIRQIIAKLLELTRMENRLSDSEIHTKFSDIRLGELIMDAVDTVSHQGFPVSVSGDKALFNRHLFGDRDILSGVLQNILGNSIKFSSLKHTDNEEIEVSLEIREKENSVLITIRDNGPGVPDEDLHRIFDRFFRSAVQSIEGSGLGLAIAKTGVLMHKGTIELNNRIDIESGIECRISLPLKT